MDVQLHLKRFNPEVDAEPHWEEYRLETEASDRILDLLHRVKWTVDGTLTFRRSCGHGVCGSDVMLINGRNRLACKTLVQDVGPTIRIAPMPSLPVIKDFVVDFAVFWERYRSIMPFLVNDDLPPDGRERRQSPKERERIEDTSRCILCGACTSACPVFWTNRDYIAPAAIVNAHRFIFDTRDRASDTRLQILADENGAWRCRTIFNCVEACPRGINVTGAILEVTRAIGRPPAASS